MRKHAEFIKFILIILVPALSSLYPSVGFAQNAALNKKLYDAVQFQNAQTIKALIKEGADVNYKHNGRPLLVWAAQGFSVDSARALVEANADINLPDESVGHTALMRAIDMHNMDMLKFLLDNKANPNLKNAAGESCLEMAVATGKATIIEALLAAGADPKIQSEGKDPLVLSALQFNPDETFGVLSLLARSGADLNQGNAAFTPLSYAIDINNIELVKKLLELGVDPNRQIPDGGYPLGLALSEDKLEILKLLLANKANPNVELPFESTPLSKAIDNRNIEAVNLMIEAGVDLSKASIGGRTPLEYAEQNYVQEIAEIISKKTEKQKPTLVVSDSEGAKGSNVVVKRTGKKCSMADAAIKQMELHGKLQKMVEAGKLSADIFRTFGEDTKGYADMLVRDPSEACDLFENLAVKYGVR